MLSTVQLQILEAFELFFYAYRYRNARLVLILDADVRFETLLPELRLLHLTHIPCLIVCHERSDLEKSLALLAQRGLGLAHFSAELTPWASLVEHCSRALEKQQTAVVSVAGPRKNPSRSYDLGRKLADACQATKLFLFAPSGGLLVDGKKLNIVSLAELQALRQSTSSLNLDSTLLDLIESELQQAKRDLGLLPGVAGSLFQELFTHAGAGTLFTEHKIAKLRRAEQSDVLEIASLLQPYIENGVVLPISEDEIAANVAQFYVHTVNNLIVATACLVDYGNWAELAKFATLLRYQRQGLARDVALEMIEMAQTQGKERLFALSTEPPMWKFFEGLGFSEIPRENLPEKWRENYDMTRPSKALALNLSTHNSPRLCSPRQAR